ncbi:hypothetical protein IJ103_03915 [Candidatus Saccharibacteria bacterium]|nr:hypothetical protein [Candidatus Saccharibacteria bacterium]MBQ9017353.1 hypothetical protein [Candidatus Saccharibacteria bacterium]
MQPHLSNLDELSREQLKQALEERKQALEYMQINREVGLERLANRIFYANLVPTLIAAAILATLTLLIGRYFIASPSLEGLIIVLICGGFLSVVSFSLRIVSNTFLKKAEEEYYNLKAALIAEIDLISSRLKKEVV